MSEKTNLRKLCEQAKREIDTSLPAQTLQTLNYVNQFQIVLASLLHAAEFIREPVNFIKHETIIYIGMEESYLQITTEWWTNGGKDGSCYRLPISVLDSDNPEIDAALFGANSRLRTVTLHMQESLSNVAFQKTQFETIFARITEMIGVCADAKARALDDAMLKIFETIVHAYDKTMPEPSVKNTATLLLANMKGYCERVYPNAGVVNGKDS